MNEKYKGYDITRLLEHPKLGYGFEIDFTEMHEPPEVSIFDFMKEISEHYGTNDIDIDEISERGCDTCDYGSRYGFTIQVYSAKQNVPDIVKQR